MNTVDTRAKNSRRSKQEESYTQAIENYTDQEILDALQKFLNGTYDFQKPEGEKFGSSLVGFIGEKLLSQLGKLGEIAGFTGDFRLELLKTWTSLNPSQKLKYITEFLVPFISNPAKVSHDAIKDYFYGKKEPSDIGTIVSVVFRFITGKTIEQFLNVDTSQPFIGPGKNPMINNKMEEEDLKS